LSDSLFSSGVVDLKRKLTSLSPIKHFLKDLNSFLYYRKEQGNGGLLIFSLSKVDFVFSFIDPLL